MYMRLRLVCAGWARRGEMGQGASVGPVGLHTRNRNKARFESNVALPSSELSLSLTFVQRRHGHKTYP